MLFIFDWVGDGWAWALFWALFWVVLLFWVLFWALKRVKPLKNVLSRVNLLFWALKKVLKRADLLKRVLNWEVLLKRGLNWAQSAQERSRVTQKGEADSIEWDTKKKVPKRGIAQKTRSRSATRNKGCVHQQTWVTRWTRLSSMNVSKSEALDFHQSSRII